MDSGPDERYGPPRTEILDSHDGALGRPRLAVLLVVAVIALAAGGGVAYVATRSANDARPVSAAGAAPSQSASPSPSTPPRHGRGPGGFGRFGGLGGLGLGGLGGVLHGQVTVPKSGGGYQTVDVQRGTVTAVSASSITVKSADGYSASYVVSSSTEVDAQAAGIGTVKQGDTVELTATVSGSGTATAASITDLTSIQSSRGAFNFPAGSPAAPASN